MKYVALLRGINVGGNNKIEMKRLKEMFEALGFLDVITYINSGNVIFTTQKAKEELSVHIEKAIQKTFGYHIPVTIRTAKNIEKLCKTIPDTYLNDKEQRTDVLFLWDAYDSKKSIDLIKYTKDIDTLLYSSGAIIWNLSRNNFSKSGMHKFISSEVYKNMTARNVNTVRKLWKLLQ